ncbi:hypothetical protein J6590_074588 [Homalodisca vitripennis]|nr:hypothetical protein J6590_074588 [Homalodisca vitripennis]
MLGVGPSFCRYPLGRTLEDPPSWGLERMRSTYLILKVLHHSGSNDMFFNKFNETFFIVLFSLLECET